jgi:hypothetical protein
MFGRLAELTRQYGRAVDRTRIAAIAAVYGITVATPA